MVQDARKFQYSSDYPQPLVVYRNEFTITPSGENPFGELFKFEHGLPFAPLVTGVASYDANFGSFSELSTDVGLVLHSPMDIAADDTYIYIAIYPGYATDTNYIRVIGFAPPDYDGSFSVLPNEPIFRFNSDYNYASCLSGVINQGEALEATHNLGYQPQCRCWSWEKLSQVNVEGFRPSASSSIGVSVAAPGVVFYNGVSTSDKYYISKRTDQETLATKKYYYHIYTMEG